MIPVPPEPHSGDAGAQDPAARAAGRPDCERQRAAGLGGLDVLDGLDGIDLGGTRIESVLRVTDKSLLATGRRDGRAVVVKVLRGAEKFWSDRFAHEIGIYRALAETPAPVRTPGLVHTDSERVLVIDHLPGQVIDDQRYPTGPVGDDDLAASIAAVSGFSAWSPSPGVLTPVFDYPDRLRRYSALLDPDTTATLHHLITDLAAPDTVAHGDPLPANLLLPAPSGTASRASTGGLGTDEVALLDFEFTGLLLPGFDLAMLGVLLANTPGADAAVRAAAVGAGVDQRALLVNRAMVLTRELRLHRKLDDLMLRGQRLALIEPQLHALAAELREYP